MNKQVKYTYSGINQDITKSKHPHTHYFEGQHIKLLSTDGQSTGSITNEKGTSLVITIPSISINTTTNRITYNGKILSYTNNNEVDQQVAAGILPSTSNSQIIIGSTTTRTGIVLFTTDNLGMDCIWSVEDIIDNNYELTLLYVRNLGFSPTNPIQALFNYENENIQKVYWVDGNEQIRSINIRHNSIQDNEPLIDVPSTSIDFVGKVTFSQPVINEIINGGNHTSGMIQYAYNLYRLNSSQTKLSPLSKLIPLSKGSSNGGGELNEIVGSIPIVTINNIDTSYNFIKVYAIKYTSLNQIPSISLIEEREITGSSINIYDDGNVITTLSLEEFIFLGSDPIIPKHIETKDSRLFPANIKSKAFLLPDELDTRAYSYAINSNTTLIYNNVTSVNGNPQGTVTTVIDTYNIPINHDAVNLNYDLRKYQNNSSILGGEGKYIKYEIVQKSLTNPENARVLKDEEIYRIGVEFYNDLGQTSLPKWIGDYKMPKGNLAGNYNTLKVTLKPEFYTWLNSFNFESNDKPVGYRVLIAERRELDKTILAQGIVTPMMFQVYGDEAVNWSQFQSQVIRQNFQDGELKIPSFLSRTFQNFPNNGNVDGRLNATDHLRWLNDGATDGEGGEIYNHDAPVSDKVSQTFLHTKMMQLYSPEILFETSTNVTSATRLRTKGLMKNTRNGVFAEERLVSTQSTIRNGKTLGGLNPWRINTSEFITDNNFRRIFQVPEVPFSPETNDRGFIGLVGNAPSNGGLSMVFVQFLREYNTFITDTVNAANIIYGKPEISERGASSKFYNNDPAFQYANSLLSFASDGNLEKCSTCPPITSINTLNARNVTLVLGAANQLTLVRRGIEDLYNESSLSDPTGVLLTELVREPNYAYLGNIYGGNSYEDKKRTKYIGIGAYSNINTDIVQIDDAGDTFVQKFKFLRLSKSDTEVYDGDQMQFTEVIEYPTETSVDLKNRNDISFGSWDDRFQPQYSEFHKYNTVYSQQSNLIANQDVEFNFRRINNFDTRIQATKLKIPNESIDSWTDILSNTTLDLNGKFGPINNIIEYEDNLYTFQDEGIARLSINPRVQVQAEDGIGIELGTGGILYDYNYITTRSGSINKWGIVSTKKGIYYYDALNKGVGRIPDSTKVLLTDIKGLHSYFNNNYIYNDIKVDNPILNTGVVFGYDNYNNDVYMTFHQGDKSFTRCFNELRDEFIDLKSYIPNRYIYKGEKLLGVKNNNNIYEHYKGNYNSYYGVISPSYVILQLNPEADYDCVFDNIQYNSEVYLNTIDQPLKTLTHIQAYNEYQNSGRIPLIVGRDTNLRRQFREWRADIPRNANSRGRIRNPWIFLKLELDNVSNYHMILHDVIIKYTI